MPTRVTKESKVILDYDDLIVIESITIEAIGAVEIKSEANETNCF